MRKNRSSMMYFTFIRLTFARLNKRRREYLKTSEQKIIIANTNRTSHIAVIEQTA